MRNRSARGISGGLTRRTFVGRAAGSALAVGIYGLGAETAAADLSLSGDRARAYTSLFDAIAAGGSPNARYQAAATPLARDYSVTYLTLPDDSKAVVENLIDSLNENVAPATFADLSVVDRIESVSSKVFPNPEGPVPDVAVSARVRSVVELIGTQLFPEDPLESIWLTVIPPLPSV